MGVGFEEISIFLKERAYGQVGILGHAAVIAFAAAAFTGEHGAGALDVLMESMCSSMAKEWAVPPPVL